MKHSSPLSSLLPPPPLEARLLPRLRIKPLEPLKTHNQQTLLKSFFNRDKSLQALKMQPLS